MTATSYRLIALHGFLGSPADWNVLEGRLPDARVDALDLWESFGGTTVTDWPSIGAVLSARLQALLADDSLPAFLLAYSFGARLALAVPWLGAATSPLRGTCLVSCHPGLPESDDGAKSERKNADDVWAQRFIDAPVATIWKEWDAQPVFAGTSTLRRENILPAPRVALSRAMRLASLGTQPDRHGVLRAWRRPLLWATGARDPKFRAIAESLKGQGIPATFWTCEHAGHRVVWDNPAEFSRGFQAWVDGCLKGG